MASMNNIAEGFAILRKYVRDDKPGDDDCAAEHDILYAGPSIPEEDFSAEDRAELDARGWHYDNDCQCWARFT